MRNHEAQHRSSHPAPEPKDAQANQLALEALVSAEVGRQLEGLKAEVAALREGTVENKATFVVFSGDLDKLIAAFIIATGAAAAGLETSLFFTFWGLSALRKKAAAAKKKGFKQRMMGLMTARGSKQLGTSKMNYFGAGAKMLRSMMKEQNVSSLEELIEMARELGVKVTACGMSMEVMGIEPDEIVEGVTTGGVAAYVGDAARSRITLFI